MRLAMQRNGGAKGFTQAEFREDASEVASVDLSAWFAKTIDTTTSRLRASARLVRPALQAGGRPASGPGWLGAEWRVDNGRALARTIRRATPAYEAGSMWTTS